MSIIFETPQQLKIRIARNAKEKRLELNLSRQTLAARSRVPESTIKRFETVGDISLSALLRIALALDCLQHFTDLFKETIPVLLSLSPKVRKRGRV